MFYFSSKDFAILYNNSWYNTVLNLNEITLQNTLFSSLVLEVADKLTVSTLVVVGIGHVHLGHRYLIQKRLL